MVLPQQFQRQQGQQANSCSCCRTRPWPISTTWQTINKSNVASSSSSSSKHPRRGQQQGGTSGIASSSSSGSTAVMATRPQTRHRRMQRRQSL